MSFSDSEPDYSSLPGNEKMLWRLREAAEIIAFTESSVVSPGDEPLPISRIEVASQATASNTNTATVSLGRSPLGTSGKVGAAYAVASRNALAEADWVQIRNRALVHARWLEYANRWTLPKSVAEDVVHDAIRKVLEGTRRWDPNRVPNLDYFVVSVVRRDYDNIVRRLANQPQNEVIPSEELPDLSEPMAEDAIDLKRMVEGALYELRTQKPDLYEAFVEFERLGLFDGRSAKLVASDLGISRGELSKRRSEMVDLTKDYLREIRERGKPIRSKS